MNSLQKQGLRCIVSGRQSPGFVHRHDHRHLPHVRWSLFLRGQNVLGLRSFRHIFQADSRTERADLINSLNPTGPVLGNSVQPVLLGCGSGKGRSRHDTRQSLLQMDFRYGAYKDELTYRIMLRQSFNKNASCCILSTGFYKPLRYQDRTRSAPWSERENGSFKIEDLPAPGAPWIMAV